MDFDDLGFPPAPPEPAPAVASSLPGGPMAPLATPLGPPRPPFRARATAGLGAILAAAGAGAGAVIGGPLGALGGLAAVGSLRNLYRSQAIASADANERAEGARSLALGVVGVAIVAFIGYRLYSSNKDRE